MFRCDALSAVDAVAAPRPRPAAWRLLLPLALAFALAFGLLGRSQAWDADRMRAAAAALGPRADVGVRDLQSLLVRLQRDDDAARLDAVNGFFNRQVAFADDVQVWKQVDYWASPVETLSKGEGDCEDFAIAKYFALVALGVPVANLRLVYVRAMLAASALVPARPQAHMVLAYYADPSDDPMILDNLVPDIRRASRRPDLTPVFSFNSDGLWQGAGSESAGDPQARISRWRDVMRKARAEGFL